MWTTMISPDQNEDWTLWLRMFMFLNTDSLTDAICPVFMYTKCTVFTSYQAFITRGSGFKINTALA